MRKILLITSLLIITNCSQLEKRGYAFDLSDYQDIKEEIDSKSSVIENMGSPTFISDIDGEELWIYYSEDIRKFLFFRPDILNRKIMAISFNHNGQVKEISNYDLNDESKMRFVSDYTKVQSHKKGWLSDIFSNIGQVRPK